MTNPIDSHFILLVEDNPDDIDLTIRSMKKVEMPHELIVARVGEEALDLLGLTKDIGTSLPRVPSLILLDLNLPGISGFDVLERIRQSERTRYIPVVVLTTSREDGDILKSYNLGANSYIQKPVDYTRFTEVVRHLGLYWLLVNEIPSRE